MMIDKMDIEATTIKIYDDYVDENIAYKNLDLVVVELVNKYIVNV